ncbi:unnamed protein product [Cuscuta campestris]|uniref:Ubiquitin-like protease family profile domain-containing protein n=1 Tax=Cuscuta campestris TaxID=132261 RepID=A0A484K9B8_9ASTE|nr:unnamed protein product [Cuscuta campestris]
MIFGKAKRRHLKRQPLLNPPTSLASETIRLHQSKLFCSSFSIAYRRRIPSRTTTHLFAMENIGASSGFQYKRRRILTQTRREEMENEIQISAEVTPSVEGQSFLDASEIEVPALDCTIDIDKIPGMKLTLKSSLGEFQNLMGEGLGDHPEVLDLFRENTPISHFLDVECIPPPQFLWQLIAWEAKIKRKGEMWFVVKGLPVRYSLREFSLISGLNCSHLNAGFENSKELTSAKNDFIRAHFPSAKKGKKSAAVTYKMVVQRFFNICKGLDIEKKKEGQEMDAVKMATLLFVVVVLLGPADRDKSAIPDWILGMIAQWTAVLGCPWGTWAFMESLGSLRKDLAAKAKSIGRGASSTMYYTSFLLPIGTLQSILVPDKFEATAEWYLNFHPLETTTHPELDAFVAKLEGRGEVHILVERKRKAWNVPSPTRDNSEERNEHISSPQESQRSQSLRESPSRVPETTIMDDCEETEARNPSPDHKVSPRLGILQIIGEINQEHKNPPSTLSDSVLSLENRMAESTHETMGTEDAALMKPLQEMVESSHEVMETDVAASMKPLQEEVVQEELGDEANINDAHVHGKVEPSNDVMETDVAASMKTLQDKVVSPQKELRDDAEITDAIVYGKRLKKNSASLKSPYTADGRKKKKADELLSKPPTKGDLLEFKSFIVQAIKEDRLVQCYLEQYKEHQEFVKTWWTDLITPNLWVADTHLSEYLYVLRRRLCNDDGDSVIAPFEFTTYVNSYAHDPQWPVLSGPVEKIVDGTYSEGQEAFKTKAWKKNTKYVYYLKGMGTHWFCIKADFERCRLVVLDSLSRITSNEDMACLLIDELRGFKGIAGIIEIGKHGYANWEFELCWVPQQNACDCGIFTVKMLELGAQHQDFKSLEKMTKEKMANMRLEIAYCICKEYHCRNKK